MQKSWQLPKTHLTIKVAINQLGIFLGDDPKIPNIPFVCLSIQVHGSLTSTYGRIQSSPWILTLAVLVGSVGFTVLVLAFFMLQNRRICSRSECLTSAMNLFTRSRPYLSLCIFLVRNRKDVWFIWRYGTGDQHHREPKLPGGEWPHPFDQRRPQRPSSPSDM